MGAILCTERSDSGRAATGDASSREGRWDVYMRRSADPTPMDPDLADAALRAHAPFAINDPATDEQMFAVGYELDPQDAFYSIGTVQYKFRDQNEGQGFSPPSFSVTGETINVRQSIQTYQGKDASNNDVKDDCGKLINVTKEGDVNGVDILRRRMRFTVPKHYPLQIATPYWTKSLAALVGTVCSHPFLTFQVGEIMLVGITGGPNQDTRKMELQLEFDTSPNIETVTIGEITLNNVKGFSYIWVEYLPKKSANGKRLISYPVAAREEQVYEYAAWTMLGL